MIVTVMGNRTRLLSGPFELSFKTGSSLGVICFEKCSCSPDVTCMFLTAAK